MNLDATFNGEPISAPEGSSVGGALLAAGHATWRTTRTGRERGLFCGIGVCYDCLVEVDGTVQRACMVPLRGGMEITSHEEGAGDE